MPYPTPGAFGHDTTYSPALGIGANTAIFSIIFGVTGTDAATYLCCTGLLLAAGLLACLVPARRAVQVDPIVVLRCE